MATLLHPLSLYFSSHLFLLVFFFLFSLLSTYFATTIGKMRMEMNRYLARVSVVPQQLGWSNILIVAPGNGSAGSGTRNSGPIERTQRIQRTQWAHRWLVIVTTRLTTTLNTAAVAVVVDVVAFVVVDVLVLRLILAQVEALLAENVNHIRSSRFD